MNLSNVFYKGPRSITASFEAIFVGPFGGNVEPLWPSVEYRGTARDQMTTFVSRQQT